MSSTGRLVSVALTGDERRAVTAPGPAVDVGVGVSDGGTVDVGETVILTEPLVPVAAISFKLASAIPASTNVNGVEPLAAPALMVNAQLMMVPSGMTAGVPSGTALVITITMRLGDCNP